MFGSGLCPTRLFPLAECIRVGFTVPTEHGFDLVGRAKEWAATGGCKIRTIVRMALVPMALPNAENYGCEIGLANFRIHRVIHAKKEDKD